MSFMRRKLLRFFLCPFCARKAIIVIIQCSAVATHLSESMESELEENASFLFIKRDLIEEQSQAHFWYSVAPVNLPFRQHDTRLQNLNLCGRFIWFSVTT